jgi:hypothetical protein
MKSLRVFASHSRDPSAEANPRRDDMTVKTHIF